MSEKKIIINIKLARLAIENMQTPSLANVWSRDNEHLLLVGELDLPYATAQGVGAALLSRIDSLWYETTHRLELAEEIMENILMEVNKTLARLLSPFPFNPQAPRYHLAIALFRNPEICVSTIGAASAFVISTTRFTNIVKTSIQNDNDYSVISKKPVFQQLISGHLKLGESLLLSNPGIMDYFSVDKLRQIISTAAPGSATKIIEKLITQMDRQPPVSLIILNLSTPQHITTTEDSVNQLIRSAKRTTNILKPNFFLHIKAKIIRLLPTLKNIASFQYNNRSKPVSQSVISEESEHSTTVRLTKKIINIITNIHIPWRRSELKNYVISSFEKIIKQYRSSVQIHRVLGTIVLILVFIFSYSIVLSGRINLQGSDNNNYKTIINNITEKRGAIEASLIYHDDAKAAKLLDEARILLAQLPRKAKDQKQEYQQLSDSLNQLGQRALRQIVVLEPKLVGDLSLLETGHWRGLLWMNKLIAYSESGRLATTSEESGSKILFTLSNTGPIKYATPVNQTLALFNSNSNLNFLVNITTKVNEPISRQFPDLKDISPYDGQNVYLLSNNPSLIYRTTLTDNSLSSASRWLNTSQDELKNAVSLTVDGSIYILYSNGLIEKYVRGVNKNFPSPTINPNVTSANKIRTSSDTDYLYILETATKRIIVIDKQGIIVAQLMFPTLTAPTDIVINKTNNLIFILDGDKVYSYSASDLTK
ncbi:MAG: hypothetical protein WC575_00155 [Patescibacteria group bacterium]